jgi:hypothetical protein
VVNYIHSLAKMGMLDVRAVSPDLEATAVSCVGSMGSHEMASIAWALGTSRIRLPCLSAAMFTRAAGVWFANGAVHVSATFVGTVVSTASIPLYSSSASYPIVCYCIPF